MRTLRRVGACGLVAMLIAACGGGDGDSSSTPPPPPPPPPPTIASGVFKDANVAGMSFQSGGQSGVTDTSGSFDYEVGQAVTFSIGGVTLGSADGQATVTPIDLVANGSTSSDTVQNIVRFLLMLDSDGDPANGITVSSQVRTAAAGWSAVDFAMAPAGLPAALAAIIASAQAADGGTHVLPSAAVAQAHLEATLRCARSGAYRGSFGGTDNGPFGVMIDAGSGLLSGFAYSNGDDVLLTLNGTAAVGFDQSASFISGDASSGATFTGQLSPTDALSGTWQLVPTDSGTFTGSRIGGTATSLFRFTGTFTGDAFGTFSFDVDAADAVQGVAHTVAAVGEGVLDEISSFSGSVTGTALTATVMDAGVVDATITGTLDKASGTLSGTWSDMDGSAGTFSGSGCRLN